MCEIVSDRDLIRDYPAIRFMVQITSVSHKISLLQHALKQPYFELSEANLIIVFAEPFKECYEHC